MSLEELIIRHALEEDLEMPKRQSQAAGVMMIPTARAGRFIEVRGLDEAKAVSGIEDVTISAHLGQQLVPLPEGSRYLGFIFARADSPQAVEAALRESHSKLEIVIEPTVDQYCAKTAAHHCPNGLRRLCDGRADQSRSGPISSRWERANSAQLKTGGLRSSIWVEPFTPSTIIARTATDRWARAS